MKRFSFWLVVDMVALWLLILWADVGSLKGLGIAVAWHTLGYYQGISKRAGQP
jgi:hypothetical protein